MTTWTRREWPETGAVEYELCDDTTDEHAYVATNPEVCAREDDWRNYVPIGTDYVDGCPVDIEVPCEVLAEALRVRGWKVSRGVE